nr:flagellin [uncultured Agathobacter sp.]
MKINRNMSAVRANRQLLGTENRLSQSMRRLSSGYKINSAEDNPAGMAISNKMKAQIAALDQAKSNSSDAQNVMRIADGALNEVTSMLQRIRELAVQGASDIYSSEDKQALQSEINQLTKEVDRISGDTEYNTKTLLDGSSDQRVYIREKDAAGNMTQVNSYITRTNFSDTVDAGKYELTVNSLATQASGSISSAVKPSAEGTISINGVSVNVKADMTQDEYIQALQQAATEAGTTMEVGQSGIKFTSNDYGSDSNVNITLSASLSALAGAGYKTATDGSGNVESKNNGTDAVVTGGSNLSDKTIRADGNRVYVVGNSGFSMDFLLSSDIDMTAGSKNLQIDISDIGNMAIQIGANEGQEMKIKIPEVSTETLYLDTVDVTVKGGADKALSTLDDAIEFVTGVRSRIGAFQNRLEYAENSLAETSEDMTGAYSNIMDTDMATEMTEYASKNILDQAGISVLAQANDLPQQVLSLLSR